MGSKQHTPHASPKGKAWRGIALVDATLRDPTRWIERGVADEPTTEATEYYAANREAMDLGHEVYWPERYPPDCLSAIQHAFDLRARDEAAFSAEMQNDPQADVDVVSTYQLNASEISRRTTKSVQLEIPTDADAVFSYVDISREVLFFATTAWEKCGRCHVIDYGSWPDQGRRVFDKYNLARPISKETGSYELTTAVYTALDRLVEQLSAMQFTRSDGAVFSVDKIGIDAAWGSISDTVRKFCRESSRRSLLRPCFGKHVEIGRQLGAKTKDKRTRPGDHWRLQSPPEGKPGPQELLYDANEWKSRLAQRLLCPIADPHACSLYRASASHHDMISEHMTAERPVLQVSTSGQKQIVWRETKFRNNDYFDCLAANMVLASVAGYAGTAIQRKRRMTPAQQQAAQRFAAKMAARRKANR